MPAVERHDAIVVGAGLSGLYQLYRLNLWTDITFGTRVTSARYDEGAARWIVRTDAAGEFDAQFLIMATGCLSAPKLPEIPGLAS